MKKAVFILIIATLFIFPVSLFAMENSSSSVKSPAVRSDETDVFPTGEVASMSADSKSNPSNKQFKKDLDNLFIRFELAFARMDKIVGKINSRLEKITNINKNADKITKNGKNLSNLLQSQKNSLNSLKAVFTDATSSALLMESYYINRDKILKLKSDLIQIASSSNEILVNLKKYDVPNSSPTGLISGGQN